MNRKIINEVHNIKLARNADQYEVIFGTMNIAFETFDQAFETFGKMVDENKPTLKVRVIRKIWGRNAA